MAENCLSCSDDPKQALGSSPSRQLITRSRSLDILILGQAGSGKSATGNSILLRKVFQTSNSSSYGSSNIQSAWNDYRAKSGDMYRIKVTDGPCLEEIDPTIKQNERQACENIAKFLTKTPNGFHVIVITVRMGTLFTDKNLKSVEQKLLKDCLEKHGAIVVTCGDYLIDNENDDDYKENCFREWCSQQSVDLQRWFNKCKNRVVLFDNRQKDHSVRVKQLEDFLQKVMQPAGKERYTSKLFHAIAKEYQEQIKQFGLPNVSEETREKISVLQGKILQIDFTDVEGNLQAELEKIKIENANFAICFEELQRNVKEIQKGQTGQEQLMKYAKQYIDEMVKIATLQENDNLYCALGEKVRDLLRSNWFRRSHWKFILRWKMAMGAGFLLFVIIIVAITLSGCCALTD